MDNLPERQPLFDAADYCIVLGAVPFQSLPIGCVAGLIVLARHWSLLSHGFLLLLGVRQVTPFWVAVFPGAVKYLGEQAGERGGVVQPGDQTDKEQANSRITGRIPLSVSVSSTDTTGFDLTAVPSDLTYEEIVTILAGQIASSGKPAYSGKKIYSFVGGNYNEFVALMRQLRSKDDAPAQPPQSTTPIAGRATRAIFRETDIGLAYEPPE